MTRSTPARLAFLAAAATVSAACALNAAEESGPSRAASAMRELQLQAGKTTCTQTAQCRTVATGHKACGGAEAYLAWSAADGDAERIGELAARQRDLRRIEVTKSDRQSTCSVVQDPGAQCVEGRCVLRRADRAD